ncbi:MAG: MerR family transcriptional regulator [Subdoligranulum variabile]|uniref:MerR family transcriptional regulator n=1 Tax=Gemmiger sp. TaxID=2049027 RepID=UPI002A918176|nr:MerR family transcriptional regulator [Gemmiger sp.]MCI6141016.1 MerR family transcriptional regulator [Subdoligranulum variabile]MDD7638688.1 MerR family transcriptional regulator [Subdoligranulum variabile]MDY5605716.1 MerR family transcriptional regulator [Gemmiger sp.]
MNIKQTADASGVSARNIRYYEQAGLLAPARNPENDYRIYTDADVRTLKLIRVLRTLDMPVEDIRAVLSGTLPLTEAAERQRRQLEAEQQKLAAAAAFCTELAAGGRTAAELDVDACLARMDSPAPAGGWFTGWVQDYRKMAAAEHKRQFTFTPDTAIATPQEFTAALLAWADENGVDVIITRESMTPRFTLDGIEYRAVRYSSHVRNIPILRVRCEVSDPSALAVQGGPKRLRVQRFLHYGLPVLVCLALAVVWVCTRNMPLWPDKAAMLLVLGALGVGYGFRGWYLYYNDRDQ